MIIIDVIIVLINTFITVTQNLICTIYCKPKFQSVGGHNGSVIATVLAEALAILLSHHCESHGKYNPRSGSRLENAVIVIFLQDGLHIYQRLVQED